MNQLRYWSFPVADGKAAVLINNPAHTSLSLVALTALPHVLNQLEYVRSFSAPAVLGDAPKARRAGRKPSRKNIT